MASDNLAWSRLLDQMETDLQQAEEALAQAPAAPSGQEVAAAELASFLGEENNWQPPANLGPLPLELADRARGILERQAELHDRLEESLDDLRRQRRAVERADQYAESSPVYLSVDG